MGSYSIREGATDFEHFKYPWRSHNQEIIVNLTATEGRFSLLILNQNAFEKLRDNHPFQPYFQVKNITEIYTEIRLNPSNRDRLTTIIVAEEDLFIFGTIITNYLDYFTGYGIVFLVIAAFLTLYYLYQKYKKKL